MAYIIFLLLYSVIAHLGLYLVWQKFQFQCIEFDILDLLLYLPFRIDQKFHK